jgi:hypothetical protein
MCAANLKQIGYYIPLYQADSKGQAVPKMAQKYNQRAQYSYVSVALRDYADIQLPEHLRPDAIWDEVMYKEYTERILPDFFVCPFARGKSGTLVTQDAPMVLNGVTVTNRQYVGRDDSYVVKRHEQRRGEITNGAGWATHPLGAPQGVPAHGALTWYYPDDSGRISQNLSRMRWDTRIRPAKWDTAQVRRVRGSSLADVYVLSCDRGQNLMRAGSNHWIQNWGSHKKGSEGGTNALFGDMHVDWVNGHRIGW